MRISVRAEHIKKGSNHSCRNCPMALAIQQATGTRELEVCSGCVWKWDENEPVCELPPKAQAFVVAFDLRDPIAPFEFELELPAHFLRELGPAVIAAPPAGNFEEWA